MACDGLDIRLSTWGYEAYAQPATLEEAVRDAAAAGYGIEVWPSFRGQGGLFAPANRGRLVECLRDIPSSLHSGGIRRIEDYFEQIDAAAQTQSDVLVAHPEQLRVGEQPDFGFARDVAAYAKERGVVLALENGELQHLIRALDNVADLWICLDIGHVYCTSGHTRPMQEFADALASRIRHVHAQDVYLEPGTLNALGDVHRPPGSCDIPRADYEYLFAALAKFGFAGAIVIEARPFTPVEMAGQARRFFESLKVETGS